MGAFGHRRAPWAFSQAALVWGGFAAAKYGAAKAQDEKALGELPLEIPKSLRLIFPVG